MNLSEEIIKAALAALSHIAGAIGAAAIGALIIVWADVRSLKKAMNSAFNKIRDLETKACNKNSDSNGPTI